MFSRHDSALRPAYAPATRHPFVRTIRDTKRHAATRVRIVPARALEDAR